MPQRSFDRLRDDNTFESVISPINKLSRQDDLLLFNANSILSRELKHVTKALPYSIR